MTGITDGRYERGRCGRRLLVALWVCSLLPLALLSSVCRAQEGEAAPAPEQEGAVPEFSAPPEEQGVMPAGSGILLNFKDAPLTAVLEHLSEVAGLVVVEEVTVAGRVSLMSRQPLSVQEAVELLNTVLVQQGYAAVRAGRVLKIVTIEDAKKMNVPVRSGAAPEDIEPTDEIITQIIPLKYADATQVREDLAPLIPAYADLSANASSNALILTDTSANVKRIAEIVSALDTYLATVAEVRVFMLTYADATDAAALINQVFQQEEGGTTRARGGGFGGRSFFRGPGGGGQQAEDTASRAPQVLASADERTNSVVVSGPSDTLDVVAQVIKELDANPVEEEAVLVYRLRNAQVATVAEVLNDLFGQSSGSTQTARTGTQQGRGSSGQEGQSSSPFARFRQQISNEAVAAAGALSGDVYCVAEEDTNTLLVLTAPTNFERLQTIIGELDRTIPQVLIKVLIAEVTWSDDMDVGVEFSVLDTEPDGDEFSLFTDFGVAAQTDGLIYKLVGGDVSVALRVLEEIGKLDILSRPHILTSDNQTATITVGQQVPFITNTRTTETGQTINTIQYEDIGIILEVTPHINPEGLVIMDVSPEISTTTAETVPISETVDAAVFAKRSASTRIAIKDDQTIVIGGLMQDTKTETVRKVPLLGDIPLLGALFRRKIEDKEKTELLIFLTPHVAREADELQEMSDQELTGVRQMKDAVQPGVFDEHMEGMRRGAVEDPDVPAEQ